MGLYSVRDLALAGIKWELSDSPTASLKSSECRVQSADKNKNEQSTKNLNNGSGLANLNSELCTLNSTIVPPTAPATLDAAVQAAKSAENLAAVYDAIVSLNHPLKQFVKNTIQMHFGPAGSLLIITDMPSSDDDSNEQILTGAAGELLDKMLSAIGMTRANVSIVPLLFWRTPGGRSATREELDLTRPFVLRAIELLRPNTILTLGTLAAAEISGAKLPKEHGQSMEFESIPTIPIYHPNYLLLKPDAKRDVWDALQKLRNLLKTS